MFLVVGTQTHKSTHVTHTQPWRGVSQLWICLRGSVSQWELWPIESRIFITQSNPAPLTWAHYSRCWNGSPLTALLTWSAQHDALIVNSLERAWRCWHVHSVNVEKLKLLLTSNSAPGVNGQTVDMDDGKSGFVDSKVDLRCRFINSSPPVKISQVYFHVDRAIDGVGPHTLRLL